MTAVRRSGQRYLSEHGGIRSRHCFAAGPHYDPDNLSFGSLVGVDEHLLAPGAGFPEHAHRGVVIASWVLDGVLRHERDGVAQDVPPGELFVQRAAEGIRHVERNASDTTPLRFVQTTWLAEPAAGMSLVRADAALPGPVHLFVTRGRFEAAGAILTAGDSLRADGRIAVAGSGEILAWGLALSGREC